MKLPDDWARILGPVLTPELLAFVAGERAAHRVHPADDEVFAALEATPFDRVRIVLLGQDPYPTAGHAHGLAFSVRPGVGIPASLANLFRERETDLGLLPPAHGFLGAWAERGVLLLNTVLTVRDGAAGSHAGRGWEQVTDAVLAALNAREAPCVFVLLGGPARKKAPLITGPQHRVLEGVHPSPLSAHGGFFGSRPFSRIDFMLGAPFDWSIPPAPHLAEVRHRDPALDALGAGIPPREPLAKLLGLPIWPTLTTDEQREVLEAVLRILPAAFVRDGTGFLHQGERYVLVPGGDVTLGAPTVKAKLPVPRRREFEADAGLSPEAFLARYGSPQRSVRILPFLAAVHAVPAPAAAEVLHARLQADGRALPDPDAWEHLFSLGSRTWFPWGADWPGDSPPPPVSGVHYDPDLDQPELTRDPFRWRAGGLPLPGAARPLLWAPSLEADALSEPLPWPRAARMRPVRPIFPYAIR